MAKKPQSVWKTIDATLWLGALLFFAVSASAEEIPPAKPVLDNSNVAGPTSPLVQGLQEAVQEGIENYPGLMIASKATELVARKLDEARHSFFLPQATVTSFMGPVPELPASSGPPVFPKIDEDFRDLTYFFRADFEALQPLYTFGRLKNLKKLAEAGHRATELDERKQLHELVYNIKQTYLGLCAIKASQEFLNEVNGHLLMVQEKINVLIKKNSPEVTEIDRLKVDVFRADLERRQITARENAAKLRYVLALLTGHGDKVDEIKIKDFRIERIQTDPFDMEISMAWARDNNAQLRQLEELQKIRQSQLNISKGNLMPLVFLGGSFSFAHSPGREPVDNPYLVDEFNRIDGGAALGIRQDLSFHLLTDRYRQARAELDQVQYQRRLAEEGIKVDVRAKVISAEKAGEKLRWTTDGLKSARSWLTAEMNNYEFGLIPTKDVLEAFIAYAKAKFDFIESIFDYNIAAAQLSRVTFREVTPIVYKWDGRSK